MNKKNKNAVFQPEMKASKEQFSWRGLPDERGYYGNFGGAYIPEMLVPNIEQLRLRYLEIMQSPSFLKEFHSLLKIMRVGRHPFTWQSD